MRLKLSFSGDNTLVSSTITVVNDPPTSEEQDQGNNGGAILESLAKCNVAPRPDSPASVEADISVPEGNPASSKVPEWAAGEAGLQQWRPSKATRTAAAPSDSTARPPQFGEYHVPTSLSELPDKALDQIAGLLPPAGRAGLRAADPRSGRAAANRAVTNARVREDDFFYHRMDAAVTFD